MRRYDDPIVTCIFDKSHRMPEPRLQWHYIKCQAREDYLDIEGNEVFNCQFYHLHMFLSQTEVEAHQKVCPKNPLNAQKGVLQPCAQVLGENGEIITGEGRQEPSEAVVDWNKKEEGLDEIWGRDAHDQEHWPQEGMKVKNEVVDPWLNHDQVHVDAAFNAWQKDGHFITDFPEDKVEEESKDVSPPKEVKSHLGHNSPATSQETKEISSQDHYQVLSARLPPTSPVAKKQQQEPEAPRRRGFFQRMVFFLCDPERAPATAN
jgi:hypothetical protein